MNIINYLFEFTAVKKYFKRDILYGVIFVAIYILLSLPIEVIHFISGSLFIILLLSFLFSRPNIGGFRRKLIHLARIVYLVVHFTLFSLAVLFALWGTLFSSFRLIFVYAIMILWTFFLYKLFADWSMEVEQTQKIEIRKYKATIILITIITLITFLLKN